VRSQEILDLLPIAFYFNSWELFDQIINMLVATLVVFKDRQTLLYLFWMILKYYVSENHYRNIGHLMQNLGSSFEQNGEYNRAMLFYFNALQWAMVQKETVVRLLDAKGNLRPDWICFLHEWRHGPGPSIPPEVS
jgi:hypothetical protein